MEPDFSSACVCLGSPVSESISVCDLVCMGVWLWEHEFACECVRLNPFLHLPFVLNLALSSHPGLHLSGPPLERLCSQDTDFGRGGCQRPAVPAHIPYVT